MKLPQLSLRELFLLVVIAAMGCGWWVDRTRQAVGHKLWFDRAQGLKDLVERGSLFGTAECDDEGLTVEWGEYSSDTVVTVSGPDTLK